MKLQLKKGTKLFLVVCGSLVGVVIIYIIVSFTWFVFHLPPQTKVELALIKLDNSKYEHCREPICMLEKEGIIRKDILSQNKETSFPVLLKFLKEKKQGFPYHISPYIRAEIIDILR